MWLAALLAMFPPDVAVKFDGLETAALVQAIHILGNELPAVLREQFGKSQVTGMRFGLPDLHPPALVPLPD